jgi:predicted nuclease of restriction endonuclease-like (RecB) superfamily
MSQLQANYIKVLNALKDKIRHARLKVAVTVNSELINLYWEIGNAIASQEQEKGWGAKVVERLAVDLASEFSDMKGLSKRNLRYMRDFALAYPQFSILRPAAAKLVSKNNKVAKNTILQPAVAKLESNKNNGTSFVQPPVAQIPWTHHTIILDKAKTLEERLFYIEKTVQNGWSKAVLSLQIESELYKRQGNSITNFKATLASPQSDLAHETLKNPYVFDFLSFSEEIKERELEKALTQHLNKFMRELGRGFAFVGNQKNVNVDGDDFFLDLLFYNYHLHCFVIFELKVGDFKPEYAGKLNFYVNTINEQLKGENDNPTIGVLLCKTPNETVVKYSLHNIKAPIGVSDYRLANALPKQIKTEMPTIEELEQELEKEIEELKKPVDKKFDRLKELISGLKQPKVKEKRSPKTSQRIFTKVVLPLRDEIKKALTKISKEFSGTEIMVWTDNQGHKTDSEAQTHVKKHKEFNEYRVEIRLRGFKPAGTKAFDIWKDLCITMNSYNYTIGLGRHQQQNILPETLYHELPDKKEFDEVVEKCTENILDDITQQIERIQKEKK